MNLLLAVPVLTFVLGVIVGAAGALLYMKRRIEKLMENPLGEMGEMFEAGIDE